MLKAPEWLYRAATSKRPHPAQAPLSAQGSERQGCRPIEIHGPAKLYWEGGNGIQHLGSSRFFPVPRQVARTRRQLLGPGEGRPFSPAESWLGGRHPCSQGSAGRAGKGKAVALVEVGRGGEGSRLCSVQRCSAKGARLTYSLCPSQGGACFSLRVEVPVRELCLKSCALSLSVGLTMPPPARGGGCQRGGDPPWRVSAQKPWQNASKLGTQHTSATAGRGSSLFREAGTKRNEFPDCSILLPGP